MNGMMQPVSSKKCITLKGKKMEYACVEAEHDLSQLEGTISYPYIILLLDMRARRLVKN